MKLRLTPLNLVSSVTLVSIAYLALFRDENGWRILGIIPLMALAAISFIADLIFRRLLKDIKRIWIIELVFIIFVATLTVILSK